MFSPCLLIVFSTSRLMFCSGLLSVLFLYTVCSLLVFSLFSPCLLYVLSLSCLLVTCSLLFLVSSVWFLLVFHYSLCLLYDVLVLTFLFLFSPCLFPNPSLSTHFPHPSFPYFVRLRKLTTFSMYYKITLAVFNQTALAPAISPPPPPPPPQKP